ncbi:MAG TPA: LAGLIDADG family homing endonuclease [Acidimicrobiales bacterium]|nr:LAGLIDADG family homing endonuclease [Acidimicrobiales bacterium]
MAIAPERMGIGIQRRFTTPGQHPYDTVVWEQRDARIVNFATGAVAFEQLGVEVPSTWSLNATNILAQKYFRGTLGTPDREWSLKQVVDRVVDTITAWGRKDGYFVDDAEAETFSDELKYLIIHQKIAFNSPVWFNIGVDGVPQQGSACQPYDALVCTPEGLVPIGKLVETNAVGTKVYDADGLTKIVAVKANGRKRVLRIHTKAGLTLDVTPDHLVWRASGYDAGCFVEAGELQPGDQLTWHRTETWGGGEIFARDLYEAALAGWLQSDGFVGQYEGTNRSLTMEAITVTPDEHTWVSRAIDQVFPSVHRHERSVETKDPSLDCRRTRLYGTGLEDFISRWGLRTRGADMEVPSHLFEAPLPVVRCYLRSVFQAEGYVSLKERSALIGCDMISEKLIRGAQILLARFGIFSRVRFKRDRRSDRKGCWSLTIRNAADRRRFADEIGFIDERKSKKLEESFDIPGRGHNFVKLLEIDRVEDLGDDEVFDIQTESGEYLSGNLRVHNCFILAVEDSMDSILNWYTEEGIIFKGGSGAGVNLSKIRSSKEGLRGGGTASGPVSFMRGADASAGTIKSGGKTRRAAKMVILNADHPDIEDFIWCKAIEESKARALRDAGFDMDLDGKDSYSIQYQNANNSVRVTDEFMHAVLDDADWHLRAISDGEVLETIKARDLFRQIAKAAWECADPGMQFDSTINRWHTAPNTDRINASNPCFTGDSLVHTDKGLIPFKELFHRANNGETFGVYTHDVTNPDHPSESVELTRPEAFMITGFNEIVRLRFDNGMEVRCTSGHKFFTVNRGYVGAGELTSEDRVKTLNLPAPAISSDWMLPISADVASYRQKGDRLRQINLPDKWSVELGHYLGWLVGDGSLGSNGTISAIYGTSEEQEEVLPRHSRFVTDLNGGSTPKPSRQANGTVQQRLTRRAITAFFAALGFDSRTAFGKHVPSSIYQAPEPVVSAFLQGLFDADGCVRRDDQKGSYVGLGSTSRELLIGVQRLLTTYGISSTIYSSRKSEKASFTYTRRDGVAVEYASRRMYDLRISASSIPVFAARIGFSVNSKASALGALVSERSKGFYKTDTSVRLVDRVDDGYELTYNLSEARNHSYIVNGLIVRNCSEYMHLDNSACNLASLNLLTFLQEDGSFDVEGFKAATEIVFTGQEIIVGNADYPTEKIAENSRRFRQLGIGYANLGALLMAQGLPYDSDGGRAWAGAITALLTGHSYATSARTAARMGPFAGYQDNREPMLDVLRMHRDAAAQIDEELVPPELLSAAQESWDSAVEIAEQYGVRNSQASVLAPTGTIGLLMDCDTTGIEPDLSLVKMKKLVGGGTMSIVNQTVPRALRQLGYSAEQVDDIIAYIDEHKSIIDAPHLSSDHFPVFACSMGDNTIHYSGHIRMMGAVQPFISGAISKTVNVPEDVTVEDVEQLHIEAWQLGLKAIAIYRDNCKVAQPLATAKKTVADPTASPAEVHDAELALKVAELEKALQHQTTVVVKQPIRERLPRRRSSSTFAFRVADCEGYVTVGEYDDGRPGEVFMKVSKQGSTLSGIMDAFSIAISLGLQHGVPLATFVKKYTNMRFEPAGMTDDPDLRIAQSLMDYIFRRLAVDYLPFEERAELGVLTTAERTQQTLPGIEETVTHNLSLDAGPQLSESTSTATTSPANTVKPVAESDAPYCFQCGVQMQRAGSCHACPSCGTTSGCS